MAQLDFQLRKIDAIAKIKDEEEEARYYAKYSKVFDEANKYLSKRNVLLYGGTAINELLPEKLKFYKPATLPDIDVFCTDGEVLAEKLVKHFQSKGYSDISTNRVEALHPGTHKVFVESLQVADISTISVKAFNRLRKNSVRAPSSGIRIVDPQFLRFALHLIMAKGDADSVHRWEKALPRMAAFYTAYPPKPCHLTKDARGHSSDTLPVAPKSKVPPALTAAIYDTLKNRDYVLFGMHEIELLLDSELKSRVTEASIQMLVQSKDVGAVARDIVSEIETFDESFAGTIKVSPVYPEDEFLPRHVFITYKGERFAAIYNTNTCVSYVTHKGLRIASIHTIMRMYLAMLLSPYPHFDKYNKSMECLVNTLSILRLRMRGTKKKLFEDVVGQCYGSYSGLVTMQKERRIRLAKNVIKNNPGQK